MATDLLKQLEAMQSGPIHIVDPSASTFGATAECAMVVALASGGASDDEMTKIVTGLTNLSDGAMDRTQIAGELREARARIEAEGVEARSAALAAQLATPAAREAALLIAAKVAWGGGVDDAERAALGRLANVFGVDEPALQALIDRAKGTR